MKFTEKFAGRILTAILYCLPLQKMNDTVSGLCYIRALQNTGHTAGPQSLQSLQQGRKTHRKY
jgi:hypothetical protein